MSWGQSRETPSSSTDTHPEGRLDTTTALCLEQRWAGGSCRAAGRVPLRVLPGTRREVRVGRCGVGMLPGA